jgi:hypothetical protein
LGEHLIPHQGPAQTNQMANSIQISKETNSSVHCQCNDFELNNDLINKGDQSDNLNDVQCKTNNNEISPDNLIEKVEIEIFLIDENLRVPLLTIADKLLGKQNLNFEQLTPPEQKLWNLFKTSDIYEFLTGEKDTVP